MSDAPKPHSALVEAIKLGIESYRRPGVGRDIDVYAHALLSLERLEEQNEALREFYLAWRDVQSGIIDFDLHRAAVDRLEAAEEALRGRISFSAANASEPVEATQGPSTDGNPSSHPGSEASVPAKRPSESDPQLAHDYRMGMTPDE